MRKNAMYLQTARMRQANKFEPLFRRRCMQGEAVHEVFVLWCLVKNVLYNVLGRLYFERRHRQIGNSLGNSVISHDVLDRC
jgi:hypothetical protein